LRAEREAEKARTAAAEELALAKEQELQRIKANAEAKLREEARLRHEAEAKAAEESRRREEAEKQAREEAEVGAQRTREEKAARESDQARAAAAEKTARLREEELERVKATAEQKLRGETKRRKKAEARVAEESRRRNEAEARERDEAEQASRRAKKDRKIWYYTCEGERIGPVGFAELRAMAAASSLDPRLDMVWKQGSAEWIPAGQVDGLFERRPVPAEIKGQEQHQATGHGAGSRLSKRQPVAKGSWPGIRRRGLLLAVVVFPIAWHFGLAEAAPWLLKQQSPIPLARWLPYANLVSLFVLVIAGLKRLVNVGMSRWWLLATLVPVLNLWVLHRCLTCPAGFASHRRMDGVGTFLAILYWFIVTAALFVVIRAFVPHA
jgi:hypothetical protein